MLLNRKNNDLFDKRYRLIKSLGTGGMSQVWEAYHERSGTTIALKIYSYEGKFDDKVKEAFLKEFKLIDELNHPNVIKIKYYDIEESTDTPYLVCKIYRRGSASGIVNKSITPLDEKLVASFMQDATSALNYLHTLDQPIVHQDIKPDNFLIDDDGSFILTDFGISIRKRSTRLMQSEAENTSDFMPGDRPYIAPEKFRGVVPKPSQDIFSFGATLYEILTGVLPFQDFGGDLINKGGEIPDLDPIFNYSSRLNQICRRCMDANPSQRPSAEELLNIARFYLTNNYWPSMDGFSETANPISVVIDNVFKNLNDIKERSFDFLASCLKTIKNIRLPNVAKPKLIYGTAASLVILISGFFFYNTISDSNTAMVKQKFEEHKYEEVIKLIEEKDLLSQPEKYSYKSILPFYAKSLLYEKDTAAAVPYLEQCVTFQDADTGCIYNLGYIYYKKENYCKAFELFNNRHLNKEPRSTLMIGYMYFEGLCLTQNQHMAVNYFISAKNRGNHHANYLLAQCYNNGLGAQKDPERAKRYLEEIINDTIMRNDSELYKAASDYLNQISE
ncbi:MAG: serine/threonine-protein kinase [Bacteroidota bacterium]